MEKVSFGYEEVAPEEKTRRVGGVFSRVAARYDLMNDLMSGGMHRLWKDRFVRRVAPRRGEQILDMAGGTGDIAFRLAASGAQVTVADINADMLAVGVERGPGSAASGAFPGPRRCRGTDLPRQELRCLHDRLRHPERHPPGASARRSAPRAEAGRALLLPGILDHRVAWLSPALRCLSEHVDPRLGRARSRRTRRAIRYLVEIDPRFPPLNEGSSC
jgi:demethylmenaquinone methyltransferase/2-methoxy-6-polyprenyl-1,4-benzoquinol methylase